MHKLLRYLKGYEKQALLAPLFKMLEACFELFVPLVVASIIDTGIKNSDTVFIWQRCGLLVLLAVIGLTCSLTAQYFSAKAALGFGTALRKDLFRHIDTLSYSELDGIGTPTLVTRMTSDINQVQNGVNLTLRLLLRSPFIVIGALIMAFSISPKLTLLFVAATAVISLIIWLIMRATVPIYHQAQNGLNTGIQTLIDLGYAQNEAEARALFSDESLAQNGAAIDQLEQLFPAQADALSFFQKSQKAVQTQKKKKRPQKGRPDVQLREHRNLPRKIRKPDAAQEKRKRQEKTDRQQSVPAPSKFYQFFYIQVKIISGRRSPEQEQAPPSLPVPNHRKIGFCQFISRRQQKRQRRNHKKRKEIIAFAHFVQTPFFSIIISPNIFFFIF